MAQPNQSDILLDVKGLKKYFPIHKGLLRRHVGDVRAVDNVNFFIRRGETLGLVGESGCGKTTASRTAIRLYEATDGQVRFLSKSLGSNGDEREVNIFDLPKDELKLVRREIAMIFQDPINSLNPRMSVSEIIREPLQIHDLDLGAETDDAIVEVLEAVGLRAEHMGRYPHEFSGGQRQRIGVARALSLRPSLILLDEPVSALDVSIQAQTLNLLQDLQEEFGLTYLFVAHDLSVVEHISDRVAVMYVGRLVEMASSENLYAAPLHPYTEALLSAVPKPDPRNPSKRVPLTGQVPDPSNPPSGCYFHPRCPYAKDICKNETPELREVKPDHFAACHLADELELIGVA
ncbi:MAG: oligopeptide/dipeptide ABC transporter ATP-binding protein [Chloroflexota bacterium]